MFDIQIQAENYLDDLLSNIHKKLAQTVISIEEDRQLMPVQSSIISQLDKNTCLYQSLIKVLAIDSYINSITSQTENFMQTGGLFETLSDKMQVLGMGIKENMDKKTLMQMYHEVNDSLREYMKGSKQQISNNQKRKENKMESSGSEIHSLIQQNNDLKKKLAVNDQQLVAMELKLTQLLKEHSVSEHSVHGSSNYLELREELAFKESEIERMNDQFSYEIQKYNTVYEAMKKQLQEMRSYQNVDLIQQIQMLETQIVRLREESQRDQMIIRQLRSDIAMNQVSYQSPRVNPRQYSRYNY